MNPTPPIIKGQTAVLDVTALGSGGEGIAHIDGFAVFVKNALPQEKIAAKIDLVKKNYAVAHIEKIISLSPERIAPACPIYAQCGGCQLAHLTYDAELNLKRQTVIDALERIGVQKNITVPPVIGGTPINYRNKMQFPVGAKNGRAIIGCYAQGTHTVIETANCLIQKPGNNAVLSVLSDVIRQFSVAPYDETTHSGVLRHVMGREGENGAMMVVLVTRTAKLPHEKEIVAEIVRRVPKVKSIWQNVNEQKSNVILGSKGRLLWGEKTITEKIGDLTFGISPLSFFQVNTEQARRLYEIALDFAALTGQETVIDAYCGTGTISLFLAKKAKKVWGIEIVPAAIDDARKNARTNRIDNAEFICGDAAVWAEKFAKKKWGVDVAVLDPPRAGCAETLLNAIAAMKPQRIVYVSCNPATLARDAAVLDKLAYKLEKVQCVDMFPRTVHIETVGLFDLQRHPAPPGKLH